MNSKEFTATVSHLSHDGRGIAHIDGKTTFISGALPQEKVTCHYVQKRSTYDEAQVIEILEASENRAAPLCRHFGVCGGCSLQHLKPEFQTQQKEKIFFELLKFQGGMEPENYLKPIIGDAWGYRRKARLSVKYVFKKNKLLVGFREKKGHYVADIAQCEILHPSIGKKIDKLTVVLESLSIREHIPQLEIAVGDEQTAIIIRHMKPFTENDLEQLLKFSDQENFVIYLQPNGLDSIHILSPNKTPSTLFYELKAFNLKMEFHPAQFVQINAKINEQMVALAVKLLDPQPQEKILDLFCGIGNFSLPIAQLCQQVIAIEGDTSAVLQAEKNAQLNHITNTQFFKADLSNAEALQSHPQWGKGFDKILLDPPRTGALEIIPSICQLKPKKILYISCNPATLARDAKIIIEQGYVLKAAGIMDMFPHTAHVEGITIFERR